jgi:hypothetical protein
VALSQYYSGQVAVFLNNGDGTLAAATFYSTGANTNPVSVAVGDVTGDGIPDLVVALVASNFNGTVGPNLTTFPGNGDGTFGPEQIFIGPEQSNSTLSVVVADLNGDGVADAAIANYYGTVDVFLSRANPLHVQLLDPSGNVVADGDAGATNVDESISNFIAPADGTYYVRMTGTGSGRDYTVVVTRGATFDLEDNDIAAQAQDITNSGGALGTLYQPPAVGLGVTVNGLSSDDNPSQVNSPDTQIAVGPSQVVEVTQTSVRVFDKSGNVEETEQLGQVFSGINPNLAYFQPQLIYDDTAQRWYIAADSNDPSGGIDINLAVSNDANPLDGFTEQHQLALGSEVVNAPYMGFNANAIVLYVALPRVPPGDGQIELIAIDKSSVLDQDNSTFVTYAYIYSAGGPDLVPARMYGASPSDPMYLVQAGDQSGQGVRVVTLTNALSNDPLFTETDLSANPYNPNSQVAAQPGGTVGAIQNNVTDVQWRNGRLVAVQNVSEPADNFATVHVRWYEFDTTGVNPVLVQQGSINPGPGISTYDGAISIDSAGDLGVSYTQSSATQYPSMYVTGRLADDPAGTMAVGVQVQAGTSTLNGTPGLYGGIAVDPSDGLTFWAANEYAGSSYWNTGIASFQMTRPADHDQYTFAASAGQEIQLQVTTPVSGPGAFTDNVDPAINLYDPNGNLVGTATGVGGTVTYDVGLDHGGTYRVDVVAANGTDGEYFLSKSLVTLATATISGQVFNDLNGDGVRQSGEPAVQGWTVDLIDPASGTVLQRAVTDNSGNYAFGGVILGNYTVQEEPRAGWVQTTSPKAYSVTVQPGETVTGLTFGDFQLATVSGEVFLDANDNRRLDPGETGIAGITIALDGAAVTTTDANGKFTVTGLGPGAHTISEVTSTYLVTAPASASYAVTPTSGQAISGDNFADVRPAFTEDNGQPGYSQQGGRRQLLRQGWNGSSEVHAAGGAASATWQFGAGTTALPAGVYEVFVTYVSAAGRGSAAPYTVHADGGGRPVTVKVDQSKAANQGTYQGVGWERLGRFSFKNGRGTVTLGTSRLDSVDADGILLVPVGTAVLAAAVPDSAAPSTDRGDSATGSTVRRLDSASAGPAMLSGVDVLAPPAGVPLGRRPAQDPWRGVPAGSGVRAASGGDGATADRAALADLLFSRLDQGGTWPADLADFLARQPLDPVSELLASIRGGWGTESGHR